MLTSGQKVILEQIKNHFEKIEELYNSFDNNTQEFILNYHNYEGSLPHSIRWGQQAAEELLEIETVYEKGTKFIAKSELRFVSGYVPKGTIGTIEEIQYDSLLEEDCAPFQFSFEHFNAYKEEYETDSYYVDLSKRFIERNLEVLPAPVPEENEYTIPVTWEMGGEVKVAAGTFQQAVELAKQANLPEGEYIDSSFRVDSDMIEIEINEMKYEYEEALEKFIPLRNRQEDTEPPLTEAEKKVYMKLLTEKLLPLRDKLFLYGEEEYLDEYQFSYEM